MKIKIILAFVFLPSLVLSKSLEKQKLTFTNGQSLIVELANDFQSRNQGLMNRTKLVKGTGMLFVFEQPEILSFWMKNTFIPLSIAYFDGKKVLQETYDMKAQSMMEKNQDTTSYPSQCRCQYALEVNKGWFQKSKIKKGMSFKLSPLPKSKN